MAYRIIYLKQKIGVREPEPFGQETVDLPTIEATAEHALRKLQDTQTAELIPSGVPVSFLISEGGNILYEHPWPVV
jgi:hypothetical protein